MAKRRPATRGAIDAATHARLLAIGPYEFDPSPKGCPHGGWTIRFDLALKAAGLPDFDVWLDAVGPGPALPPPADELFALWERYRAAHRGLCPEYRRYLFGLLSQRPKGQYTPRMWRALRRTPPTVRDMRGALNGAKIELYQRQARGQPAPVYEAYAEFLVYWDEHGVVIRLHESDGGFALGDWTGIDGF